MSSIQPPQPITTKIEKYKTENIRVEAEKKPNIRHHMQSISIFKSPKQVEQKLMLTTPIFVTNHFTLLPIKPYKT